MTRTVTKKALQLLSKSVSDIAGNESGFADSLRATLRASEITSMAPANYNVHALEPAIRQHIHGHTSAIVENVTLH
ncbi:MAG: hypothetical protein CMM47_06725 [Rhodospirillaceae bacterium]|nr:hypothetical protein [Rhodospirillaceae bacterium]